MSPAARRAGMPFILITLFLDVVGIGIVIPVLPVLVTEFCDGDASAAASYYGWIASSYALMQFLFAPALGALSDRFGRRPVILVSLFGFGVNYVLLALAPTLGWLFAARLLSGITGASMTTANAYIADVSTPENRARNFGMVGAVFGIGFVIGPALGGLLGALGPRMPFWVSAAIVAANWLYGLLVLPESLPPERRRRITLRDAQPLGGIALLRRYPLVTGLAVAFVFASLAQRGLESVWVLYTQYRYGWEALHNGLALALVGVMAVIVQGGLIRRIVPWIGERRAVVYGMAISTGGMVCYGLATDGRMMLVIIVVAALGGIAFPSLQSLVAGAVSPSEQGGVQGALTSLMSATAVISPLISTGLFATFTGPGAPRELPGIPFFAGAAFFAISLALVVRTFRRQPAPPSGGQSADGDPAAAGPAPDTHSATS